MANYAEARRRINEFFISKWMNGQELKYPTAFDNQDFKTPDDKSTWVRFSIREFTGAIDTFGDPQNNLYRKFGAVYVNVFTPKGEGMQDSANLASEISDYFEGEGISEIDLSFNNVRVNEQIDPTDQWNQINIIAEFDYYNRN